MRCVVAASDSGRKGRAMRSCQSAKERWVGSGGAGPVVQKRQAWAIVEMRGRNRQNNTSSRTGRAQQPETQATTAYEEYHRREEGEIAGSPRIQRQEGDEKGLSASPSPFRPPLKLERHKGLNREGSNHFPGSATPITVLILDGATPATDPRQEREHVCQACHA
jgi:hypothetical protein